jgi:hypothetical protein
MNAGMPVESPVRGDSHAGFGGRPAETERPKGRHRAAGRPYLGGKACDQVRRDEYNKHGRSSTDTGKWIKGACYSLLKDTANQTPKQLLKLAEVVTTNKAMYRAFLLYSELRYIYKLPKQEGLRAARRVARVGVTIETETVHQARPHAPQTQTRRARGG